MKDFVEIDLSSNSTGSVKINGNTVENVRGLKLEASVEYGTQLTLDLVGVDVKFKDENVHISSNTTSMDSEWTKTSIPKIPNSKEKFFGNLCKDCKFVDFPICIKCRIFCEKKGKPADCDSCKRDVFTYSLPICNNPEAAYNRNFITGDLEPITCKEARLSNHCGVEGKLFVLKDA